VLGPLLFNVYIIDFPCIINKVADTILFADDTNILISSNNFTEFNMFQHPCTTSYKNKNHQLMHKKYIIFIRRKTPTCFDPLGHLQGEQFRYTRVALIQLSGNGTFSLNCITNTNDFKGTDVNTK
jgi:hypothetical protein